MLPVQETLVPSLVRDLTLTDLHAATKTQHTQINRNNFFFWCLKKMLRGTIQDRNIKKKKKKESESRSNSRLCIFQYLQGPVKSMNEEKQKKQRKWGDQHFQKKSQILDIFPPSLKWDCLSCNLKLVHTLQTIPFAEFWTKSYKPSVILCYIFVTCETEKENKNIQIIV